MRFTTLSVPTLIAVFFSLGACAENANTGERTIQNITPDLYQFAMSPLSKVPTDCTRLNKLLANYASNKCDTDRGTLYCKSILAQIQTSQEIDFQSSSSMDAFVRGYRVVPFTNVPDPTVFSKRFDVTYTSAYDFTLDSLEIPNAFRFEGGMTSAELSAESKLGLGHGYKVDQFQGDKYVRVSSIITACALKSGRISMVGNAKMNISTYHPVGKIAYDIAERTYKKGKLISGRESLSDAQKNYLFGMIAGEELKKFGNLLHSESELDEVALSLQSVLTDNSKSRFTLVSQEEGAGLGARLLDPGFVVPNAPIQILYKGE